MRGDRDETRHLRQLDLWDHGALARHDPREPRFAWLERERREEGSRVWYNGCNAVVHRNPRFYKYLWWIFHQGSPCDGSTFLATTPLCTLEALNTIDGLRQRREPCLIYNRQHARLDPRNPFDPLHPRWRDEFWAPRWEDDPDPAVYWGELRGHK